MELKELLFADRSERGKIAVTGEQAAWFLHQVVTQEFEDIKPGQAREAAMLTVHGRMIAYFEAAATEDGILIHFEPELTQTFPQELSKYIFATRVEVKDVTDEYGLVLLAGEGWREIAPDGVLHPTRGLGVDAGYVWVPSGEFDDALAELADKGIKRAEDDELEDIRITHGAPRWGKEMTTKTLPQEAGIEEWAVHFEKGCYLGQEAMAKIHFRGKVNRKLRRLVSENSITEGADVTVNGDRVGVVTSASANHALAILKYTVEPGTVVRVGDVEAEVS
jgi:folate-binding protein YgfZ